MNSQQLTSAKSTIESTRETVTEVLARLDHSWTPSDWKPSNKPVDELIATILSQNTSDTNTDRAFRALRNAYPDWTDVLSAPSGEIEAVIRAGGLAKQKAPRIQQALAQILNEADEDPNQSLLRQLRHMETNQAMEWLTAMKGVGPKTAACVLLFAVGKPVVPVDTHVFRVARRVGLIDSGCDANRAHEVLPEIVPAADSYRFHMHLIHHGRTTCKARNPRCADCVINDLCSYWREQLPDA